MNAAYRRHDQLLRSPGRNADAARAAFNEASEIRAELERRGVRLAWQDGFARELAR